MPIDNDVYDRIGDGWWDESNPLNILHGSLTPGRLAYFHTVMDANLAAGPDGLQVLDIGCGGGFLTEEFARMGCRAVGVDPSTVSIETARRHAAASRLDVEYRLGRGEDLPAQDSEFDLVLCCDVLEHVNDVDRVLAETARVLKPGGLYLFDTVNRTLRSKIVVIRAMQEWSFTRIVDVPFHDWLMFIRPHELVAMLHRHGLAVGDIVGLAPRRNPAAALAAFVRARRGQITYGELSRRLDIGQTRSTAISYMGFATKA
ncbi:MAG TPA: bifunctional 2-polyprenyl-6-hydroxyphenol methylase/3-demethylubiquinol 3-O-methyltransferase UbiG [Blastococcus sp.]|nr:bifunctional 2-polyprenyl-6-hydroxyphenol methylase/3-demethylubiquinol 3-O-methyltransferase UbiG [Blastococcus sp.]